jgi:hypothetical protein
MAAAPDPYPGMPRWVKLTAVAILGVIALGIVIALLVGGEHGPARHISP